MSGKTIYFTYVKSLVGSFLIGVVLVITGLVTWNLTLAGVGIVQYLLLHLLIKVSLSFFSPETFEEYCQTDLWEDWEDCNPHEPER
jgi:hypothetical protein